jgi:hypothetical protein
VHLLGRRLPRRLSGGTHGPGRCERWGDATRANVDMTVQPGPRLTQRGTRKACALGGSRTRPPTPGSASGAAWIAVEEQDGSPQVLDPFRIAITIGSDLRNDASQCSRELMLVIAARF